MKQVHKDACIHTSSPLEKDDVSNKYLHIYSFYALAHTKNMKTCTTSSYRHHYLTLTVQKQSYTVTVTVTVTVSMSVTVHDFILVICFTQDFLTVLPPYVTHYIGQN
jgi:hypothetical protein